MGITNLKKLIKGGYKTSPIKESLIKTTNILEFEGEKIAIDISSYIYKYKVVYGDDWLNCIQNLICMLKKANIHGVSIFDGKPPVEKEIECARRREVSTNLEDKLVNIEFDLHTYKDTNKVSDLLKKTMESIIKKDDKIKKITNLLHGSKKNNQNDILINVEKIEEYIENKNRQIVKITPEDIDSIKKMMSLFGATYIQAPGEAESLAAYLFSIGEVKAVITEDTDILTYGVETYISGLNSMTGECEVILLSEVLESLELNLEEFRDFCIMCGSDYGNNIKGVGTATALKHIQKYKSIEEYIKSADNIEYGILNHIPSREIFKTFGRLSLSEGDKSEKSYKVPYWDTMINFELLFDFLSLKKCRYSANNIREIWDNSDIVFED